MLRVDPSATHGADAADPCDPAAPFDPWSLACLLGDSPVIDVTRVPIAAPAFVRVLHEESRWKEAQRASARQGIKPESDTQSPLAQFELAQLYRREAASRALTSAQIPLMVAAFLRRGMRVPAQLAADYVARCDMIQTGHERDWSAPEVFGSYYRPGEQAGPVKAREVLAPVWYETALTVLEADPSQAVSGEGGILAEIGAKDSYSSKSVERYVADHVERQAGQVPSLAQFKEYMQTGCIKRPGTATRAPKSYRIDPLTKGNALELHRKIHEADLWDGVAANDAAA